MTKTLQQAVEAIRRARSVVLATHVNPDGDTLGSALAIALTLREMGKDAVVLSHDGVPEILRWMPGTDTVQTDTPRRDFDLAIVCDTSAMDRIGRAQAVIQSAPETLCIDHHVAEGTIGSIRIVNAKAAATAELVYRLLGSLGAHISKETAECLLCGLITDTGSFRFMNVTPQTLRTSARLMEYGACPAEISELVFENRSVASLKLLGRALDSLETIEEGRIAWARITAADFQSLNATDADTEGIVTHVRSVKSAVAGLLFREVPDKKVRVSLRSRDGFDVNRVANAFGGGGHKLAAGCTYDGPLDEAEKAIVAEVKRWLD
jgi:phosphoesterase RecJ-like protein